MGEKLTEVTMVVGNLRGDRGDEGGGREKVMVEAILMKLKMMML